MANQLRARATNNRDPQFVRLTRAATKSARAHSRDIAERDNNDEIARRAAPPPTLLRNRVTPPALALTPLGSARTSRKPNPTHSPPSPSAIQSPGGASVPGAESQHSPSAQSSPSLNDTPSTGGAQATGEALADGGDTSPIIKSTVSIDTLTGDPQP